MTVYGGANTSGDVTTVYRDVWELSLHSTVAWTKLATYGVTPWEAVHHTAIYDSSAKRMIVYNGDEVDWRFRRDGVWVWIQPGGDPPEGRLGHTAIYDSANKRMIVYGGMNRLNETLADVWELSLPYVPYSITVSANPGAGGDPSGGGSYEYGTWVYLYANPANGYSFTNWTEDGRIVSSNPTYFIWAQADHNLVANYQAVCALAAPTLFAPVNESTATASTPVILEWGQVSGTASYRVQVDDSMFFDSPIAVDTTQAWTTPRYEYTPPYGGIWFWRVAGIDDGCGQGPWSEVWRLEVSDRGFAQATLLPESGGTLSYTDPSGTEHYHRCTFGRGSR